ncbi:hypothetical protein MLD38_029622 [Melastoma candidum]|uniref:Uncharacterized protein n=1 Tax=Melastoma candidum TaxID=119954 RepID=A0ACB9N4N9_9MYRT|nr:hypothetical protein MLD38_029622 [Melastoma candidum]
MLNVGSNLRLLFLPSLRLSPFFSFPSKPRSLFAVCSSVQRCSDRPFRQQSPRRQNPVRRNGSCADPFGRERKKEKLMEEGGSFGFNRKRAEGRDKGDGPRKELSLKKRPRANPVSTIAYVQILGTGMDTQDTSPSVLLFFDNQRFIFNAGEGLQRFCTEHKVKLSKIDCIFLSRVCSETAGGLPGLLLTLAGIGEKGMSIKVCGPSDLTYLVDAMKSFVPHAATVHTESFGLAPCSDATSSPNLLKDPIVLVDDDVVKISAIILSPSRKSDEEDIGDSLPQVNGGYSSETPEDMSVVYVCELPELKGKFHPERAMQKGLKPGPEYRELQLGKSVFSKRLNIMVHPSDVMDPSTPGPVVLLVDCPTKSHLKQLLDTKLLQHFYSDSSVEEGSKSVSCVIHLSAASIVSSPRYQSWMKRFGSSQHIIAGHHPKNVEIPILYSSARIAARLNYLCPQFFPASGFWSLKQSFQLGQSNAFSSEGTSMLGENVAADNLLKFTLRPRDKIGLDRSSVPNQLPSSEVIGELHSHIPEIVDVAKCVRKIWDGADQTEDGRSSMQEEPWLDENTIPSCLDNIKRDDLEIVFLGTGSSQPSKYRNVSAIHINLFAEGGFLFDCGEGTLGQMKRRYGVEGADNAVKGLRCIWISHIHADHHSGLARILTQRRDLLKEVPHEPMLVIGPRQLKRYLNAYERLEDLDMQFLDCRHTTESSWEAFQAAEVEVGAENEQTRESCNGSVAQLTHSSLFTKGAPMQSCWKKPGSPPDITTAFPSMKIMKKMLGEMGDTRPCPELTMASKGATVLIHEATFEDAMVDEAIARNHSTTEEAIQMGAAAGAYRIILTHFSQRYPKIPVFDESHMHKTCIAFDLMSVNLADLHLLPKVLPYLKLLFRNDMTMDESEDVEDIGDSSFALDS